MKLLRHPSAFLPIAMSLVSLAMVIGHYWSYGTVKGEDEGTAAHLFQLLMAAQVPIVGFFAIKWMTREPVQAARVLALQAMAGIAAFGLLFFLERT